MTPLAIGQERSIRLIDEAVDANKTIALVTSRSSEEEAESAEDLHEVGTSAVVHKMVRVPDGTLRVLVQGLERVKLEKVEQTEPYLAGRFTKLPDVPGPELEVEALAHTVESLFGRIISMAPYLPEELLLAAANAESPSGLANLIASTLRLSTQQKQELLEAVEVEERLRKLTGMLSRELEVIELGTKIQSQVHEEMDKSQREYFLRQQLKAIQDELGEGDEQQAEITELRTRLEEANLPEEPERAARRELDRLAKLPPAAAEYGVIRTYLEWLISVPWTETTKDDLDLGAARAILDEDHYDLDKVKERILEHLAVQKLTNKLSGPILCFVGPPGVGKTSLGQSIARALGRKFVRVSVGGVRDESEIRGHRRTYVGAMPGTIIRALRDAGTKNPVFMIDEIDKMGADWRGDPSSAMLEVLDPAQNSSFRDHYLDLPFDLSQVLFICTANQLEPIPGPLRDRMEIIPLAGYTEDEKVGIARTYLVPKQLEAHGLDSEAGDHLRERPAPHRPRVHARGGRAEPRPRARRHLPQDRARDRRGEAQGRPGRRAARPRLARGAALPRRGAQAHVGPRRRHGARGHAGRRGRPLRGGDRHAGLGTADDHGPDRRRDAGVGAGGALVGARPRRRSSASRRTGSRSATSTSTCPQAPCPRTAPRPASPWRPPCRRWP